MKKKYGLGSKAQDINFQLINEKKILITGAYSAFSENFKKLIQVRNGGQSRALPALSCSSPGFPCFLSRLSL